MNLHTLPRMFSCGGSGDPEISNVACRAGNPVFSTLTPRNAEKMTGNTMREGIVHIHYHAPSGLANAQCSHYPPRPRGQDRRLPDPQAGPQPGPYQGRLRRREPQGLEGPRDVRAPREWR